MNTEEFAKYVINNMHRATLSNALNISEKLDNPDFYKFEEFVIEIQKHIENCLKDNKLNSDICYKVLSLISYTLKKYRSDIKYSKTYIVDDFIIDLWNILDREC